MILRLAISVEHRLMVDKQTDRQTHNDGICIYRASMALRGKNGTLCYDSTVVSPNITLHYHWGPFTFVRPLPVEGFGGGLHRLWDCSEGPLVRYGHFSIYLILIASQTKYSNTMGIAES